MHVHKNISTRKCEPLENNSCDIIIGFNSVSCGLVGFGGFASSVQFDVNFKLLASRTLSSILYVDLKGECAVPKKESDSLG